MYNHLTSPFDLQDVAMKSTDKFLIWLVVGVLALVAAALVLLLAAPEPAYQPDDDPGNVVHNYILAIHQEDFARAYSYLYPGLLSYPEDVFDFERDLGVYTWYSRETSSIAIDEVSLSEARARVQVSALPLGSGELFNVGQSPQAFYFELISTNKGWKVTSGDRYFAYCWDTVDGCR